MGRISVRRRSNPVHDAKKLLPGEPSAGRMIDSCYEIHYKVSEGTLGTTYCAIDKRQQQKCALKLLNPKLFTDMPHSGLSFLLPFLDSPPDHTAAIFRWGQSRWGLYVVSEWIEAPTLRILLRDAGLPAAEIRLVFKRLVEALTAIHATGPCGSIKPENIFHATTQTILTDSLLPTRTTPDAWVASQIFQGVSYYYLAPEVRNHKPLSVASDIYALGVLLHEILTRTIPSNDIRRDLFPTPYNHELLQTLIGRCLSLDPGNRPSSASAFWDEAQRLLVTSIDQHPTPIAEPLDAASPDPLDNIIIGESPVANLSLPDEAEPSNISINDMFDGFDLNLPVESEHLMPATPLPPDRPRTEITVDTGNRCPPPDDAADHQPAILQLAQQASTAAIIPPPATIGERLWRALNLFFDQALIFVAYVGHVTILTSLLVTIVSLPQWVTILSGGTVSEEEAMNRLLLRLDAEYPTAERRLAALQLVTVGDCSALTSLTTVVLTDDLILRGYVENAISEIDGKYRCN